MKSLVADHLKTNSYSIKLDSYGAKIIELIAFHYPNNEITVAKLADLIEWNERTFRKKCVEVFRKTPTELLIEARIFHAKKLLRDNLKVSEIWYRVGFSSHSYFSEVFKQYSDMTPKKYAQSISS